MTVKDYLESIIGAYTPDYTAQSFGQIDWPWILSAILIIVLVVTFMKCLRFVLGGFKK